MRLRDKVAIVVGAGQSPGEGVGNGRATVVRFVQEGAKVLAVDSNLASAEETVAMARQSGAECVAFAADVTKEATLAAMVAAARERWGRIDVLHYNVGVSIAGGDAPLEAITEAAFDRIAAINLRGAIMACKQVVPVMRAQRSGSIIMISSVAAWEQYPNVVYKATKAGMVAFTQQVAIQNAEFGVRANVILPGRARAVAPQDGDGLGRGERRLVPGLRRGKFYYRGGAASRWRRARPHQLNPRR